MGVVARLGRYAVWLLGGGLGRHLWRSGPRGTRWWRIPSHSRPRQEENLHCGVWAEGAEEEGARGR